MYPDFAEIAYDEGFDDIGKLFLAVASVEGRHMKRFQSILDEINLGDEFFKSDDENTKWVCLNCGHIVIDEEAPLECPVCNHPQKYFAEC